MALRRWDRRPSRPGSGPKPTGAWAGYLIFGLCLLIFVLWDAQTAYQRQWSTFAGLTVLTAAFVVVPTGGARRLRGALRSELRQGCQRTAA